VKTAVVIPKTSMRWTPSTLTRRKIGPPELPCRLAQSWNRTIGATTLIAQSGSTVRPCDRGRSVGNPASCKWVGIVPSAGRWL